LLMFLFFSSRRRHTRFSRDWSSDVCSSDLEGLFDDRLSIYNTLSKIYNETGRYKSAYETQVLFSELFDSLYNGKLARISNQLERSEERRVGREWGSVRCM